jgi:hypothetical protein
MMRKSILLVLALLLGGCAALRSPVQPDGEAEERQTLQLISYAQRLASMTAEQLRRESSANNQAFSKDQSAMNRMRLVLSLAAPGASVQDTSRAASLLEPMAATGDAPGSMRSLARLLFVQLNERVGEQKRASQMREQVDALKESERTLRQQLDALKEVERSILQRAQESQPRRR